MARTKYKLLEDETVGLDQPVFKTQYWLDYYTNCFKCNRKVSTTTMYVDNDGSQKHMRCLSPARLEECCK